MTRALSLFALPLYVSRTRAAKESKRINRNVNRGCLRMCKTDRKSNNQRIVVVNWFNPHLTGCCHQPKLLGPSKSEDVGPHLTEGAEAKGRGRAMGFFSTGGDRQFAERHLRPFKSPLFGQHPRHSHG
jgi:hypothetical protein